MIHTAEIVPVPDAWREANTHLRLAVLAEAAARQLAAGQRNVSTTLRHQTEKFCHALPAEAAHH